MFTLLPLVFQYNPNFDENNETGEPEIDPDAILWIQKHQRVITDPSLIKEKTFDGKYVTCLNCPSCTLLAAMSKLYKVCSHPSLVQVDNYEVGRDAEKKLEFAKIALPPDILSELPGGSYYKADGIMNDHLKLSGKMRTLDYCLNNYQRKGDRVLVFSNSVATLDLIQQHIKTKGYTNLRLDGSTQTSARQTLVDKFQNDDSIFMFLISTKAGGLGLNLTAANKVIIFDVNWNPSLDEQAQDRSFRIGQKNDVEVVRLVARGTIEELMYARQVIVGEFLFCCLFHKSELNFFHLHCLSCQSLFSMNTRQVYKVQLKKQTFGSLVKDGKNQPQIFRGVSYFV